LAHVTVNMLGTLGRVVVLGESQLFVSFGVFVCRGCLLRKCRRMAGIAYAISLSLAGLQRAQLRRTAGFTAVDSVQCHAMKLTVSLLLDHIFPAGIRTARLQSGLAGLSDHFQLFQELLAAPLRKRLEDIGLPL